MSSFNVLLFGLVVINIMLLIALIQASLISLKHGDDSAAYPLFAARDALIDAAVLHGVPREDPWLDAAYTDCNAVLAHSHRIAGPGDGWTWAERCSRRLAQEPSTAAPLFQFPDNHPIPKALIPALVQLDSALAHLGRNHLGFYLQLDARRREQVRVQREKAKSMRAAMRQSAAFQAALA